MKYIALLPSETKLQDLAFNLNASGQKIYLPTFISRANLFVKRESGRALNGQGYSHVLNKYRKLTVTISSDQLDDANIAFIEAFLSSATKYIAVKENGVWGDYKEVIAIDEDTPIAYIDDLVDLPEITLNLEYLNKEE